MRLPLTAVMLSLSVGALEAPSRPGAQSLTVEQFKHISFSDIPPTKYQNKGTTLHAVVRKSASVLLRPFPEVVAVKRVRFEWKTQGKRQVKNAAVEETKDGDDFLLRVGLLVHGKEPLVPFFAPSWVKAVRDVMIKPSDEMHYLVVGSHHRHLQQWDNPYSDSMKMQAVDGKPSSDGWLQVDFKSSQALPTVGLWIIADGDNSGSEFDVWMRELILN